MEDDDDDFGDLYTDIPTPSFPQSLPQQTLQSIKLDDRLYPVVKKESIDADLDVTVHDSKNQELGGVQFVEIPRDLKEEKIGARVLDEGDVNLGSIEGNDGVGLDVGAGDDDFEGKEENFGIEEVDDDDGGGGLIGDFGEDPIIPGLGTSDSSRGMTEKIDGGGDGDEKIGSGVGGGDEWDSDESEDDLQIVLNDNGHGRNGMMGIDDEEDEDGESLVIVTDADAGHPPVDEQEWGEDAGQTADGERKESAEGGKVNGGSAVAPKAGYSSFGYHPFHSQFKYVRPGAAPLPTAPPVAPGGAPGQVHPSTSVGPTAGRGRGDWRPTGIKATPPAQKGFQPGFWGSNTSGRGYGGGLDFTLPSHKTIFEVDIDSFEEKPWKYPGIDLSDFFNFGMNEESWKEYCKQLEQTRLESTMQSRIRVYERGRGDQGYDPELPPELAAAASHEPPAENANAQKTNVGPNDLEKGATSAQPSLPIGRAIPVEIGYGERLPTVDTRPPRFRDSDAIIEIVLDASDEASEQQDIDDTKGDQKVDITQEDSPRVGSRYSDEDPDTYRGSKAVKKSQSGNSLEDGTPEEKQDSPSPLESPIDYHDGSRSMTPANSGENIESSFEKGKTKEDPISPPDPSRPASVRKSRSVEDSIASDDEPGDGKSRRDDVALKDKDEINPTRKHKLSSHVEPLSNKVAEDEGNLKGFRSSENSKATGSSRDHEKLSEEEVIQDRRSTHSADLKRHRHEDGQASRRKDQDGRVEHERTNPLGKVRDDPYSRRERDPYASLHVLARDEALDRRKERDYAGAASHRREDDPHGRRVRVEDPRKHEHFDEATRHRGKARDAERSVRDEQRHSTKPLENGSWRGYEKEAGTRYHENMEDLYNKRRKDDVHVSRDRVDKEILLPHRETSGSRKRERDEQPKFSLDDRHSVRQKEEIWLQRERADQSRERDEFNRSKQSYEENLSRRERDDGRGDARASQSRLKDDHKGFDNARMYKDTGRNSEVLKRKERVEDQSNSRHRGSEDVVSHGNQFFQDEKRSKQERLGARNDRAVRASDDHKVHEKKQKDSRKARDSEGGQAKRRREEKIGRVDMADTKGKEQANVQRENSSHHPRTQGSREDASSDDEQQSSKRGRSKLERWASHKERSFEVDAKSSSSLKAKDTNKDNGVVSGFGADAGEESARKADVIDNNPSTGDGKEAGSRETKDTDLKPLEGRHLDTVEKLKKRSERFKLPMPSEKEASTVKKMEYEPLPSAQRDTAPIPEVKPERPARKRRWISS